jgi:hypothetical protein
MSFFNSSEAAVGSVIVATTQDKGHEPEFWAKTASDRIVSVGGNCHPLIAQQAEAFKQSVETTVSFYIKEAIKSDRTTLIAELEKQGHGDMAKIIRSL